DRANATFVTLARNSDLYSLIPSIQDVEDRFNKKYHYDWVFLNDEEFSDEFKKVTTELISGTTKYAVIPPSMWGYPDFIDQTKADEARKAMGAKGIIYGDNLSYRHMCRFESGFFWRHPVMLDYRWYWRVEPDTKLFCDVNYDLFKYMEDNNKSYGFTISMYEYKATIETLWETTKNFTKENPQFVAKDNLMKFLSSNNGEDYNLCHFWSNFEVADMDFWRGEAYTKYFDYLDRSGGFFYERWGDAPVHSIAASLFLPRDKVHHFEDVGYYHPPYTHCPTDVKIRLDRKCSCNPQDNFAWQGYSCTKNYYDSQGYEKPAGWENQS
ncbi:glycosyl transferase, partial [Nadsonia fulvescens var. elongata DSM 6958]